MKFASMAFLTAFVLAVDVFDTGVISAEESINVSLDREASVRNQRSIGVNEELKKEVEIKTKDGGSIKVSKSITYNDGGALTLLPAAMDSATNNRIRLLNQIQNGQGRPELANSMINGASSGMDSTGAIGSDFSADIESKQASGSTGDPTKHIDFGSIFNRPATTTIASVDIEDASNIDSAVAGGSHAVVDNGPTHVSGGPVATVTAPAVSRPVAVNPIIAAGACCGHPKPVTTVDTTLDTPVVPVKTGYSHGHRILRQHLQRSIEYHRRKQANKQRLLNQLATKQQQTSVVAAPAHHTHTPDCDHPNPVAEHHSKVQGLKELLAYRHTMKAQRYYSKLAAIHAKHEHHSQKCRKCCCN